MQNAVRVYHPELDTFAVVPAKSLPARQGKGWVVVDEATPSDAEDSHTPPLWGDNNTPEKGEE